MPVAPVTDVQPSDLLMKGIFELSILDAKSMLAHHRVTWDMLNISDSIKPAIEFDAASVIPRTVDQLNLKVTGENIQADSAKLLVDQPLMKAFFIPYVRPQQPSERCKAVIEYDWEEPDRQYRYNFIPKYEDFTFRLIAPKDLHVTPAIHKVRELGKSVENTLQRDQQFASSVDGDMLILEWHRSDIPPSTVYRFDW